MTNIANPEMTTHPHRWGITLLPFFFFAQISSLAEEDYCIEGECMQYASSGCSVVPRKGSSKKLSDCVFSMKELAKGLGGSLEGSSRSKSCSPKVLKTKVLSTLRRGRSGDTATKDLASGGSKKKIPHQIAITVTPSTSEDTAEDHLSLDDMKMLHKWQNARCRQDMNRCFLRPEEGWFHATLMTMELMSRRLLQRRR